MPEPEIAPSGESALDDAIAASFGADEPAADAPEAAAPAASAEPAPAPAPSEDDWDTIPSHEELVDGRKRINRIPHDRVSKIIEKQRAKAAEDARAEALTALRETLGLPADAPFTLDDAKTHVTERGTKLTEAERELQAMQQALEMEPERFLQLAAQRNPAYQRFLRATPAQLPEPPAAVNLDDFSVDLGNGNRTFSFDGLKKYIDHVVTAARSTVPQELQPLIAKAKAEAAMEQRRQQLAPLVQMAQQLPGFKEHEAEILKLIQSDKAITLPQAYEKVVWAKRVADEAAMRERIMKEMATAPVSTSTATAPAAPAKAPSVDDVIAAAIEKATAA